MRSTTSLPSSTCLMVESHFMRTPSSRASSTSKSWAGMRSRVRRYTTIASSAPSRRAVRAASIAVFPPPYTTTRRPSNGRSSPSMLRRSETASSTFAAEPAGMYARFPRCAPTARKTASKPPASISSVRFPTFRSSSSVTPRSRIRWISASRTSRGSRYVGMPKRIIPPGRGPAS